MKLENYTSIHFNRTDLKKDFAEKVAKRAEHIGGDQSYGDTAHDAIIDEIEPILDIIENLLNERKV